MAFTPKDNSGSIFVNDRKTEESHPDRTGSIMVAGVEYWINGWLRKSKDGKPYLSLSVKPKAGEAEPKPKLDDEIPF